MVNISDIWIGKVDGKSEFRESRIDDARFFDTFLVPDNVNLDKFDSGEYFYIYGFRGTGKTSLLRYYLFKRQIDPLYRRLILFKSDLDEEARLSISGEAGAEWIKTDSGKMGISQDFRSAWRWFILHKIAEIILQQPNSYKHSSSSENFLRVMGLLDNNIYRKILGFLPKIEGAKVSIRGEFGFFSANLGADFNKETESTGSASLRSLANLAEKYLKDIKLYQNIYLGFDELEAFYTHEEKFQRDLSMVRDLIFTIEQYNEIFRSNKMKISIVAAIRSEVIDAMGSLGQEVNRTVHDHGVMLAWHYANRSLNHPLIEMVRRKLAVSSSSNSDDPFLDFFPSQIEGTPIDVYLLDSSFYKPRDLVWRLSIAQNQFPNKSTFDADALQKTEIKYSQQMWAEIEYELSAAYSNKEIEAIRSIMTGFNRYFDRIDIVNAVKSKSEYSRIVAEFYARRSVDDLLNHLYRLGAIGNNFRVGARGEHKNRWIYRGDPFLLLDKRMEVSVALSKALSLVLPRRRSGSKNKN